MLQTNNLKWGLAPGNHDLNSSGVGAGFDAKFPASRFFGVFPWYGGYLGSDPINDPIDRGNKDNYELFSVGGLDFIIIHLEYDMPDYSVAWANRILAQYPNRRAIITTHLFLNASGVRPTTVLNRANGTPAETVWQQLVRPNCNVFLVLNGHYPGEANRTDSNVCGKPVHQLASDYQSRINGGDGWLRYMVFKPSENKIHVFTYSPTLNGGLGLFETDGNSQFVLDYEMQGTSFSVIATNSNVSSGSSTTTTWSNLDAQTEHEWYVTVGDGFATTTSPVSRFTTTGGALHHLVLSPASTSISAGGSQILHRRRIRCWQQQPGRRHELDDVQHQSEWFVHGRDLHRNRCWRAHRDRNEWRGNGHGQPDGERRISSSHGAESIDEQHRGRRKSKLHRRRTRLLRELARRANRGHLLDRAQWIVHEQRLHSERHGIAHGDGDEGQRHRIGHTDG